MSTSSQHLSVKQHYQLNNIFSLSPINHQLYLLHILYFFNKMKHLEGEKAVSLIYNSKELNNVHIINEFSKGNVYTLHPFRSLATWLWSTSAVSHSSYTRYKLLYSFESSMFNFFDKIRNSKIR